MDNSNLPKEIVSYFANTQLDAELFKKYQDIWCVLSEDTKNYIANLRDSSGDEYETGDMQLSAMDSEFAANQYIQNYVDGMKKMRAQESANEELKQRVQDMEEQQYNQRYVQSQVTQQQQDYYDDMREHNRKMQMMEEARVERNQINNMLIEKTVSDLRMAEYFHTGQQEYLTQQLGELMAKKF